MISPERLDVLQTGWGRLLAGYGAAPAAAYPVFDRLVAAYSEPHRHYHTLEHIAEMLKIVGRLTRFADDVPAVQLAVWFHDVVYDPRAKDNEERSALRAAECLGELLVPPGVTGQVVELVRTTAHLSSANAVVDANTAVLLDADLAVLGASEERYDRYAADVRREYAWVPEDDYRAGRAAVLRAFLARPRIYHTGVMFTEGEAAARRNLRAEIDRLNGN